MFIRPLTRIWILFLCIVANDVLAAPSVPVPAPPIFESLDTPVGRLALESFAGPDMLGKDGVMSKMGLDLAHLYHEHREFRKRSKAAFKSSNRLAKIHSEKILIDVVARGDVANLRAGLARLGMEHISVYGRVVSGYLPITSLEKAAGVPSLNFARPSYATKSAGQLTSQGDVAQRSDIARTSYSVDGSGIMVGTLSDSYDCIGDAASDQANGDLPASVTVLQEETGCSSGSDEGRAMMQIIHDVAPGSTQAFHSAFNGEADFAQGIIDLANAGAQIINDDVIYFAEPMFQDGIIAQAIDTVKGMGVAYFSAAGNQASQSYEGTFTSSGVNGYRSDRVKGVLVYSDRHDFDTGTGVDSTMRVSLAANSTVTVVLGWQDTSASVGGAGAQTDMDIIAYDTSGVARYGGIDSNIGGDAVDIMQFSNSGSSPVEYDLAIEHYDGPAPGMIKIVYFGNLTISEYNTNSATSYGHPIAAGGQAVGAARYDKTPAYGQSPPLIESFSSKGGVPILFDTNGVPINDVRQKPDIVAPDGVNTTFFGFDYEGDGWPNFFGTSAAAPHAAGVAALLKSYDSTLSPDDIHQALETTAIDMRSVGFDFLSGYGLIQADAAIALLAPADIDGDGVIDDADNCPLDINPGQEDIDGDGAGDACDLDIDGDGVDNDLDNCPVDVNPSQLDLDGDDTGDVCDSDDDGDGVDDGLDNCPVDVNPSQLDLDVDGVGDACDLDIDGDGIDNDLDNCPVDSNPAQTDTDGDGEGNDCDVDDDNDGLSDTDETSYGTDPLLADTDGDSLSDGDEVNLYLTAPTLKDTDGDGYDDDVEISESSDPIDPLSIPAGHTGDINGDGQVDAVDVLLATQIALGERPASVDEVLRGDIAPSSAGVPLPDGVIDTADIVRIRQLAGY